MSGDEAGLCGSNWFMTQNRDFAEVLHFVGRRCLNSAIHFRSFLLHWANRHSYGDIEEESVDSAFSA
jgi:hypothetical protein